MLAGEARGAEERQEISYRVNDGDNYSPRGLRDARSHGGTVRRLSKL